MFRGILGAPIAKVSPVEDGETPWADLEAAADDLESGTEMAAVAYDRAWTQVLRGEAEPSPSPAARASSSFDARLHLPLGSLPRPGLESLTGRESQATPGTGSTKRAPSARRKREQRERARPRRRQDNARHSVAGVSLAQRIAQQNSPRRGDGGSSPSRSPQRRPEAPAPHHHHHQQSPEPPAPEAPSPERPRATSGLAARLNRRSSSDDAPTEAALLAGDRGGSVGNLHAAVVDKQQRAEKRKEINRALRRKKRADAAAGHFGALGPASALLAAH